MVKEESSGEYERDLGPHSERESRWANVYDPNGEAIGAIEDVMLEKAAGKVAYAVMSSGGPLGFGKRCHPVPWSILKYDSERDGYVVDPSKADVGDTPENPVVGAYDEVERPEESRVSSYYDNGPLGMI